MPSLKPLFLSAVLCLALVLPATAHADEGVTQISAATDISPWFFSGYSAIVSVSPASAPRWRATVEVWGFDFPEVFLELNSANADEGWRRRADIALALYLDYHFGDQGEGFHAGVVFNTFHNTVRRKGFEGSGSFWSTEVLGRAGYAFFPFDDLGLFFDPWIGAGPLFGLGTLPEIGGERYEEAPFQLIGTIHTGWRF